MSKTLTDIKSRYDAVCKVSAETVDAMLAKHLWPGIRVEAPDADASHFTPSKPGHLQWWPEQKTYLIWADMIFGRPWSPSRLAGNFNYVLHKLEGVKLHGIYTEFLVWMMTGKHTEEVRFNNDKELRSTLWSAMVTPTAEGSRMVLAVLEEAAEAGENMIITL